MENDHDELVADMELDFDMYGVLSPATLERMRQRIGYASRSYEPGSLADRHLREHGHRFAYGCCRPVAE